ncbi:MAG TPA: toll/interleukin-1 receptor domain-containing protein [Ilumatobacter sp.]|nr:toll/interleukin-1 receptor domain-containing protein [Ilumatobacter sp.]
MRVFISYRRSDTGGRAGRLSDVLAARFGDDHVFHDVTTLTPGTDFDEQIDATIARCDAVLVVIGSRWLDEADPTGVRRLDRADDLVRHEVRTALSQDKRIVPVLVDGARLPTAPELPDDITPMVRRQAVAIRDESWQQDVRELIRGLERDPSARTRRRPIAYLAAAILAIAAATAMVIVVRGTIMDGDDDDEQHLASCPAADDRWIDVTPGATSPVDVTIDDDAVRFEPQGARYRSDDGDALVVVEVALTNLEEPAADPEADDRSVYLATWTFDGLLVNGVPMREVVCERVTGDELVAPGRRAIGEFGFDSEVDPAGATIELATAGGGLVPFGTG